MTRFVAALVRASLASAIAVLTSSATARSSADDPPISRSARATTRSRQSARWSVGGDPQALPLLQALLDGEVQTVGENQVLQVKGDTATDLLTARR